jgi:hypothetical protein
VEELSRERQPDFTQELPRKAPNESQRATKATTLEALIYEALFVAHWLQCRGRFGENALTTSS